MRSYKITVKNLISMIDHTNLSIDATKNDIIKTAEEALKYGFASVAIRPKYAGFVAKILANSKTKVGPAVGFDHLITKDLSEENTPERENAVKRYNISISKKCLEIKQAIQAIRPYLVGIEIDFVINVYQTVKGNEGQAKKEIKALVTRIRSLQQKGEHIIIKVILENCYLKSGQIKKICQWTKKYGADFVKTSTGFGASGAKVKDVQLMRKIAGKKLQVKAAGGIKSFSDAQSMIKAGATRIGTSSSLDIIK